MIQALLFEVAIDSIHRAAVRLRRRVADANDSLKDEAAFRQLFMKADEQLRFSGFLEGASDAALDFVEALTLRVWKDVQELAAGEPAPLPPAVEARERVLVEARAVIREREAQGRRRGGPLAQRGPRAPFRPLVVAAGDAVLGTPEDETGDALPVPTGEPAPAPAA